jgi:hypothetical protein
MYNGAVSAGGGKGLKILVSAVLRRGGPPHTTKSFTEMWSFFHLWKSSKSISFTQYPAKKHTWDIPMIWNVDFGNIITIHKNHSHLDTDLG